MGSLKCIFINCTCKFELLAVSTIGIIIHRNNSTMRLVLLFLAIPLAVHSAPDPQYRQRLGDQGGRGGGARGYGRRRPPPPVIEYDDGTNYEDSYESYNYSGETRRYGGGRSRGREEYDYRQPSTT